MHAYDKWSAVAAPAPRNRIHRTPMRVRILASRHAGHVQRCPKRGTHTSVVGMHLNVDAAAHKARRK